MSRSQLFKALVILLAVAVAVFAFMKVYERENREPVIYPTVSITVPEGYSARQIDHLLFTEGVVKEEGSIADFDISRFKDKHWFLKDAQGVEGFLFPDTYEFYLDSTPQVVVGKFLDNFEAKTNLAFMSRDGAYERLIMASLIEKEVPDQGDDRRLVAGLLLMRLKDEMRLQVDATLCYARERSTCSDIDPKDKQIDSPYNTYTNRGLPPGPICSPGLSALRAALAPKKSDYRYYISDPETKRTIFAKTLDEHNQNIVKYLR